MKTPVYRNPSVKSILRPGSCSWLRFAGHTHGPLAALLVAAGCLFAAAGAEARAPYADIRPKSAVAGVTATTTKNVQLFVTNRSAVVLGFPRVHFGSVDLGTVTRQGSFLSVNLPGSVIFNALPAGQHLATVRVTVLVGPLPGDESWPIAFTITSSNVVSASSAIAPPGRAAVVSSYKPLIGSAVVATLRTSLLSPAPVTVTTAIYSTPPTVRGTIFDAGGLYMDLLAPAAGILDSITASFYYPLSITGTAEDALKLQYWNTATQKLELVTMSNGFGLITYPLQNKTDIPPYFGGSFEVTFDRNSKPAITDLKGTIFTTAPEPLDDANVKQGPQRTQP